jgi:hypothetical protein
VIMEEEEMAVIVAASSCLMCSAGSRRCTVLPAAAVLMDIVRGLDWALVILNHKEDILRN